MITHLSDMLLSQHNHDWVLIVKGCTWKQKQPFLFLWRHLKKSKVGKRKSKGWRKKSPRCTLCTYYRWLGNSKGRKRHSYYRQQQAAWPHLSTTTSSKNITSRKSANLYGLTSVSFIPFRYVQGRPPYPQNLSVAGNKGSLLWKFSGGLRAKKSLDTSLINFI